MNKGTGSQVDCTNMTLFLLCNLESWSFPTPVHRSMTVNGDYKLYMSLLEGVIP